VSERSSRRVGIAFFAGLILGMNGAPRLASNAKVVTASDQMLTDTINLKT